MKIKKFIIFLILIIIIAVPLSGSFTIYDGSLISKYDYTLHPYSPNTYLNYSVFGGSDLLVNNNPTGYINVTISESYVFIKINVKYSSNYYSNGTYSRQPVLISISKVIKILKEGNNLSYNGSPVILPFFYSGNNVSKYKSAYEYISSSQISYSMITTPGIFQCHIGLSGFSSAYGYLSNNNEYILDNYSSNNINQYTSSYYVYNDYSKLLYTLSGTNVVINYLFGLVQLEDGKYFPLEMNLILHKTNIIVFPVNYLYVAAVFIVVAFAIGFFIIIPAAVILVLVWYRSRKKGGERQ